MTKNILLSLAASFAIIVAFALPVEAAQHHGSTHNEQHGQHAQHAQHAQHGQHAHGYNAQHGHSIKSELEARAKAPHMHNNKVMYRVNASHLNERSGPGANHKKIGTLRHGTLVEVKELSHDGKWALVHTGTWVSAKYLEKNSDKHHGISHLGELTHEYHAKHGTTAAKHGTHSSHAIHARHAAHTAAHGTHAAYGTTHAKHAIG